MIRRTVGSFAPLALVSALALSASSARADDGAEGLPGTRFAFIPQLGVGAAAFTGQRAYHPAFVGTSVTQLELLYEQERWGGFVRGGFLSGGDDGRWTAPTLALGGQYRLRGDGEERWGIVARAGLLYQRWHASTGGCMIPFFFPDNCKDFTPKPIAGLITASAPIYSDTIDTGGLLAAMRFEIPVAPVFLAFGAELSSTVDLSQAAPGMVISGQLTFSFALRDHHGSKDAPGPVERARYRERVFR